MLIRVIISAFWRFSRQKLRGKLSKKSSDVNVNTSPMYPCDLNHVDICSKNKSSNILINENHF